MEGEARYEIEKRKDYLYVKSYGERRDLMTLVKGTKIIRDMAVKMATPYVLTDYREVTFNIPLTEAFNLVKVYENRVPEFKDLTLASVINTRDREIGRFWESICQRRGFNYKLFFSMPEAATWIECAINDSKIVQKNTQRGSAST